MIGRERGGGKEAQKEGVLEKEGGREWAPRHLAHRTKRKQVHSSQNFLVLLLFKMLEKETNIIVKATL